MHWAISIYEFRLKLRWRIASLSYRQSAIRNLKFRSIYRRVLKYYRGFLGRSLIALAFSFAAIGLNLLKPWPFKIIVDQILPGRLKVFQFAFPSIFGGAIKTPALDSMQAIAFALPRDGNHPTALEPPELCQQLHVCENRPRIVASVTDRALRSFAAALAQISRHAPLELIPVFVSPMIRSRSRRFIIKGSPTLSVLASP